MTLPALALQTVAAPAEAARAILSRAYPREALWTGLLLAMVLNTMLFALQGLLFPLPDQFQSVRITAGGYFAVILAIQVVFIYGVFFAGRWLGGGASVGEVMALMIWLQLLQVAAHAALLVILLLAPMLAGLLNLAATVIGIFILLHFVNEAHGLGSLWRAFGTLLLASAAVAAVLTLFLSLFGLSILGLSANV